MGDVAYEVHVEGLFCMLAFIHVQLDHRMTSSWPAARDVSTQSALCEAFFITRVKYKQAYEQPPRLE